MDGAVPVAIEEDGAENQPRNRDRTSENIVAPSAEDTADIKCTVACQECGLKFTCCEDFETHLQQHAVEEEEEEEAETGDCRKPAAELVSGRNDRENGDENTDGGGCDMSSSLQSKPLELIQGDGVPTDSMMNNLRKFYTCLVCGKIYSYLVSFRKHQQLHENHPSAPKSIQTLNKYECPECGMSFVRRTRLLGHLRVHRSHKPFRSKPPRCDQCNKTFTSVKAWLSHTEVHKEKPFWCLVCAKGFRDEGSLDGHLQGHSLRQHKCDICHRRFKTSSHLVNHSNTHTGAKPHQCSFCGKSFAQPGNLIGHRNRYHRFHVGSKRRSLGIKNSAIMAKKGRIKMKMLTSVKEEPDMNTHMDEQPGKEKSAEESERQQPCEDAEFGDQDKSEESDCGEPMHDFKLSHPPTSTRSDPSKSETTQPQARQELDKSDLQETHVHRKHKYWEWECFECDMGFDDVAMLHLHYIKHATGELPFPQDVTEG
uniref:C2H2-type domain-containing protein n=1 Tax=Monopterus albus TaxID=43700 RepID=A0A3Q3IZ78_MONAL|nr:zinc finger protein 235-like isoform X2 [Monopterus albus]